MDDFDFSVEGLRQYIHYNKETGDITRIYDARSGMKCSRAIKAQDSRGYIVVSVFGKSYRAHRLAWFYVNGEWPKHEIDHIDGNKKNNSLRNLRDVLHKTNMANVGHMRDSGVVESKNSCGLRGVYKAPFNKWMARISIAKKRIYLGHFDTKEQAHQAYVAARSARI